MADIRWWALLMEQADMNSNQGAGIKGEPTFARVRLSQQRHLLTVASIYIDVDALDGEVSALWRRVGHVPEELGAVLVPLHRVQIQAVQIVLAPQSHFIQPGIRYAWHFQLQKFDRRPWEPTNLPWSSRNFKTSNFPIS